jgi:RNA polymerase primary sigma factor
MRSLQITASITDTESHVVTSYLQEVARTTLITAEDEAELARRIKAGDEAAVEKLIKANLRFVISVAKKYQKQGLPLSDLISEGNAGLIKAARLFDETKGFRFISFAVWWIRQAIMLALAEQTRMVRLPMNKINLFTKINYCSGDLEQRLGRVPETAELASFMQITESKVKDTLLNTGRTVSYDLQPGATDDYALIDRLWNKEHLADHSLESDAVLKNLDFLLSRLTKREKEVIELFFGLNGHAELTPQDIAEQFKITTERVRQLKRSGVSKMASLAAPRSELFFN